MNAKQLLAAAIFALLFAGCNNNSGQLKARPVYAAHIISMGLSVGAGTTSAAPVSAAALKSELTSTATTSVQNFYSGDIKWNVSSLRVAVQIQNDSDVPIKPVIMTYWDPANYPYPSDYSIDQHGLIKWCGANDADVQPGETVTIAPNFAWGTGYLQYTEILGPQDISLWVYAAPADWDGDCQPAFWGGTIQSMNDHVSTHPALATATTHFNLVEPSYTDNGNETITDNITGLVWQKQDDGTKRTWNDAISSCLSLSLADAGWRLPTVMELITIVDTAYLHPSIDTAYFPGTQTAEYWSSPIVPGTTWAADTVHFDFGPTDYGSGGGTDLIERLHYVRCVR